MDGIVHQVDGATTGGLDFFVGGLQLEYPLPQFCVQLLHGCFGLLVRGDVVEQDADLATFRRADAIGIDIVPAIQRPGFIHKMQRFTR